MKITCILQMTVQFIITEVAAIFRRQFQNIQLPSPDRASRCRIDHGIMELWNHGIFALPSPFPLVLETWQKESSHSMLQNLVRFSKDCRKCWMKQGELFNISILPSIPKRYWRLINNRTKGIIIYTQNKRGRSLVTALVLK